MKDKLFSNLTDIIRYTNNKFPFLIKTYNWPIIKSLKFKYLNIKKQKLKKFEKTKIQINFKEISFEININPEFGIIDKDLFLFKIWEKKITKIIYDKLKKNNTFLDMGANIGYFSILASKIIGNNGKVYSFEPSREINLALEENVKLNEIKNVRLYKLGCGEINKVEKFYLKKGNYGASSLLKHKSEETVEIEEIKIVKIDSILKNEKIDFIKIDVEGFELEALIGAEKIIKKYHPKIIVEFSPILYNKRRDKKDIGGKILLFLKKYNYKIYNIEDNLKEITNINKIYIKEQANFYCE